MVEWFSDLGAGFVTIASIPVLFSAVIGVTIGVVVGAIPGLTVAVAISLAIPFSFVLDPVTAFALLLGVYKGGIYGGSITAILINTPGTAAAAATVLDGYPMARKGQAGKALKIALYASVVADALSIFILILVAEPISRIALKFGPAEIFSLIVFALSIIAAVSGRALLKGLIAAGLGFMLAVVGQDPITGLMRFAFGNLNLSSGFSLIPMLIGLFAISELWVQFEQDMATQRNATVPKAKNPEDDIVTGKELRQIFPTFIRASLIGAFIGALPGIGSTVASFLSYGETKRKSKQPELFGKGSPEGLAAAEAGNNAVIGAALIPLLTLGIPGDVITAILLGALMIHGVAPGPTIFAAHRELIFGLFAILLVSIAVLYFVGLAGIWFFRRVTTIPNTIIFPVVLILCIVGAFAVNNSLFDVWIMLAFGVLGYLLRKYRFPVAPLLIAFVLAPKAEVALRQALIISDGSLLILLTHPISAGFLALTVIAVYKLTRLQSLARRKQPSN